MNRKFKEKSVLQSKVSPNEMKFLWKDDEESKTTQYDEEWCCSSDFLWNGNFNIESQ